MGHVARKKLGQAKVRDFWLEITVEEDIARLYVSMHNVRPDFLMKECETLCHTDADSTPRVPRKLDRDIFSTWEKDRNSCLMLEHDGMVDKVVRFSKGVNNSTEESF